MYCKANICVLMRLNLATGSSRCKLLVNISKYRYQPVTAIFKIRLHLLRISSTVSLSVHNPNQPPSPLTFSIGSILQFFFQIFSFPNGHAFSSYSHSFNTCQGTEKSPVGHYRPSKFFQHRTTQPLLRP